MSRLLLIFVVISIVAIVSMARPAVVHKLPFLSRELKANLDIRNFIRSGQASHPKLGTETSFPITDGANGPTEKQQAERVLKSMPKADSLPNAEMRPGEDGHGIRKPPAGKQQAERVLMSMLKAGSLPNAFDNHIHSGQDSHVGGSTRVPEMRPGEDGHGIRKPPAEKQQAERVLKSMPKADSLPNEDGHGIRKPPMGQRMGMGGMGVPGGWTPINISDPEVVKCSDFAIEKGSFAKVDGVKKYIVKSAQKQVVAGLNIDMIIDIHVNDRCFVKHFRVYDRFGTLSLTFEEDVEGASCDGLSK